MVSDSDGGVEIRETNMFAGIRMHQIGVGTLEDEVAWHSM